MDKCYRQITYRLLTKEEFMLLVESISFNQEPIQKTSAEWSKEVDFKILDPDGWNRQNFQFSWYEEKITLDEFHKRALESTIQGKIKT